MRSTGAPVHPRIAPSSGHARPTAGASANAPQPATPAYLQQAYDLTSLAQTGGSGDTVAVVDAYDDPTAESDLGTYRSTYGLPACTTANGCFQKVNQNGSSSPSSLPASNASWEQEIALDLDAVSAICPNCHILLVGANSSSFSDLQAAMWTAARLGAKQISASWGGVSNGVPSVFRTFSGVATVAATGDYGYVGTGQDQYPAALPGVTAAGGTSLAPATAASARGFGEAAWSWDGLTGGGSGCDLQFPRPSYQPAAGCAGRAYADLSADADPNTGLAVYDHGSWSLVGGTSLSTPLIAAYYAITGVWGTTPKWAYGASSSLNDVVSGSTGNCASGIAYICNAGPGYDGPTGVGSISGSVVTGAPGLGGPAIGGVAGNSYTQSVSDHGAAIAGGIYRNGLDTSWWIQYGTTAAYGSQTPASDIGAGSAPVPVTGYLSQLSPGTTYHYRLVAQNSRGTTYGYDYTFTTAAAAAAVPTAAFAVPSSIPAPGSPVSFDASASTPGASISDYSWNFGDGTPVEHDTNAITSHSYVQRGTYTVTLTVTSGGQTDTSMQMVTVDNPPTSTFTASSPVTAPTTMSFDGSQSGAAAGGSIIDYNWNFGDGSIADTGTSPNATHAYATPGNYKVTLITTDDLNVTNTVSEVIAVGAVTATPTIPAPGGQVTFDASNATVPGGPITDYSWSFDNGPPLDTQTTPTTPPQTFSRGHHSVTLITTNSAGRSMTTVETFTADESPSVAALPASPTIATPGQLVSFAGSGSVPDPGTVANYTWRFGDASDPETGNVGTSSHIYDTPGKYTATLTITDDLGVTASASQQVVVDQPTAAFTTGSATVAPNAAASFDASPSSDALGTPLQYSWNFGDGSTQNSVTPSAAHAYATRNRYQVQLTVKNQYGQSDTSVQTVTVDTPPAAAFTSSAGNVTAGAAVSFDASATRAPSGGSIARFNWSFGDGSTSATTSASTSHTYGAPGTYTVTLTATDDLGLTAPPAVRQIVVAAPSQPVSSSGTPQPPAPVATPVPIPVPVQPAPSPLMAKLTGGGRHRLAQALAHGLRIGLTVNQAASVSFQITVPTSQTTLARGAKRKAGATVVLGRGAWTLGAGAHTMVLKLPRAVASRLATSRPVVLTVHVAVTGAGGKVTRTAKITLTR